MADNPQLADVAAYRIAEVFHVTLSVHNWCLRDLASISGMMELDLILALQNKQ